MMESVFNGDEHNIPLSGYKIKPRLMIGRKDISEYLKIEGLVQAIVHEYFLYDEHRTYCWCSPQTYFSMNHLGYDVQSGDEPEVDLTKIPKSDRENEDYMRDGDFNSWFWLQDQISEMNYEACTDGHPDHSILLWDTATGVKGEVWDKVSTLEIEEFEPDEIFRDVAHQIQEDIIQHVNGNGGFDPEIGYLFPKTYTSEEVALLMALAKEIPVDQIKK